jgi:hypothetical protein
VGLVEWLDFLKYQVILKKNSRRFFPITLFKISVVGATNKYIGKMMFLQLTALQLINDSKFHLLAKV